MLNYPRDSKPLSRRIKSLKVDPDLLVREICRLDGSYRLRAAGMPEDARVVRLWLNQRTFNIEIAIESETFDETEDGEVYPELTVKFTKHYGKQEDA